MRLCRFSVEDNEVIGFMFGDDRVAGLQTAATAAGLDAPDVADLRELVIAGHEAWDAARAIVDAASSLDSSAGWSWSADQVKLHHPYRPRQNMLRCGGNSRLSGGVAKVEPIPKISYYTKAPTSVLDAGEPISWPTNLTNQVYAEAQLAIVIGHSISFATPDEALASVFGYAVATDVGPYDLMLKHGLYDKPVSLDSFFPWGPALVSADDVDDPDNLAVSLRLNGETVIDGSTSDALLSIGEMLSELGTGTTIRPGDVVIFGAPEVLGFGQSPERWLRNGDVVESTIEGVGSITNPVAPYSVSS